MQLTNPRTNFVEPSVTQVTGRRNQLRLLLILAILLLQGVAVASAWGVSANPSSTTPVTILDAALADMLCRIELPKLEAIKTSEEIWLDRIYASQDIGSYLRWCKEVRPGGDAHTASNFRQLPELELCAKSVKGLSETLIAMLDDFHLAQMAPGTVPSDFRLTEGGSDRRIESLQQFFQPLRGYMV
jgi:hypothetical protein